MGRFFGETNLPKGQMDDMKIHLRVSRVTFTTKKKWKYK